MEGPKVDKPEKALRNEAHNSESGIVGTAPEVSKVIDQKEIDPMNPFTDFGEEGLPCLLSWLDVTEQVIYLPERPICNY